MERNHTFLQGILRSGISLEEAVERYKLKINRHGKHQNLVQFKYDQIESDLSDPLVRQCRGIIMNEKDSWRIIARPFDKFFNYGEKDAAKIDWKTAKVLEKVDGTCCILYYYDGWQVATLGSADASGPVGGLDITFSKLFWDTFTDKGYKVPSIMWAGITFIWELTGPYNRIVVDHQKPNLTLLGSRADNGSEASPNASLGYDIAKVYDHRSMSELEESFESIEPTEHEGYVVVDAKYNRIKVKHPGYVRIHHMKDSFTLRNIVECIRHGEAIEFINYFPEHLDVVTMVKDSFFKLIAECNEVWALTHDIKDQKEFAKQVKDFPFARVLFAVRNGKKDSVVHALQEMQIDSLIQLLEVKT